MCLPVAVERREHLQGELWVQCICESGVEYVRALGGSQFAALAPNHQTSTTIEAFQLRGLQVFKGPSLLKPTWHLQSACIGNCQLQPCLLFQLRLANSHHHHHHTHNTTTIPLSNPNGLQRLATPAQEEVSDQGSGAQRAHQEMEPFLRYFPQREPHAC